MRNYLVRRAVQSIPTLLLLTMIGFLFISLAPGDIVDAMIDPTLLDQGGREMLEARRRALGLDQPLPVQYIDWLGEVIQGNLGYSFVTSRPVAIVIGERLGPTIQIGGLALLLAIFVGVSVGLVSGLRQYSMLDYVISVFSYGAWSFPNFYLALILIYVFAVKLRVLPSAGMLTPGVDTVEDRIRHLILPVVVLSLQFIGMFARQTRSAVLEVLHDDYVTTARAKGLRENRVVLRHIMPNALIPVLTVIGLALPLLITGAIITEIIFSWSGMGSLTVSAINARDYPVVMGIVLVIGVVVMIVNLFVDLLYAVVDPRVRYQ
ncbi:MAG: ABC transporter permease [Anaerolineae bacterium]|nr:ABC transporter permease [Anaerolineae bacterium]